MNVSATVLPRTVASTCVVSASTHAFRSISSTAYQGSAVDAVSVNCTLGSAYGIALGKRIGEGTTLAFRRKTEGTNPRNYNIYSDAVERLRERLARVGANPRNYTNYSDAVERLRERLARVGATPLN